MEKRLPRIIVHGTWFVEFKSGKVMRGVVNGSENLFKAARKVSLGDPVIRIGWTPLSSSEAELANRTLNNNCLYIPDALAQKSIEVPPDVYADTIRPYVDTKVDVNMDVYGNKSVNNMAGVEYCVAFGDDVVLRIIPD